MTKLVLTLPFLVLAQLLNGAESGPVIMDLKQGQAQEIRVAGPAGQVQRRVRLLKVQEYFWPNWFIPDATNHQVFQSAEVELEVDGTRAALRARPFEPPRLVNGLRLYVETTRNWATTPQLDPVPQVDGDVRLSCVADGMAWGPATLRFPVRQYRWQANTYRNTWGALVPYNKLYYHRGEDFGAIPDDLEVLSSLDGTVIRSPLPRGDGDSNRLEIRHPSGLDFMYCHMNLETILPGLTNGAPVAVGQVLGRTGMTWDGRRSQVNDPHVHWGVSKQGGDLGSFPFLLEAYLRDYPDSVLAMAGGYYYAMPGDLVELDASRTVARPGRRIVRYQWLLHDGRKLDGVQATVRAEMPGLFSEELRVWADDGREDRDYAQLRVWDADRGARVSSGWFYHSPVRGARAGSPVRFWNRLWGTIAPVTIDFGDGSPVANVNREFDHVYATPGLYTTKLQSRGPGGEPLEIRMRVVVEVVTNKCSSGAWSKSISAGVEANQSGKAPAGLPCPASARAGLSGDNR
jgi:murein DD-endopeptidase MepM/ murein hydrolase activator NlpD